jgi:hypothetical protein
MRTELSGLRTSTRGLQGTPFEALMISLAPFERAHSHLHVSDLKEQNYNGKRQIHTFPRDSVLFRNIIINKQLTLMFELCLALETRLFVIKCNALLDRSDACRLLRRHLNVL